MTNHGMNLVQAGLPLYDELVRTPFSLNHWKQKEPMIKRIIWAPHHSILSDDILNYSNFLEIADGMVVLAKRYAGRVQFILSPILILRKSLSARMCGVKKEQIITSKLGLICQTQVTKMVIMQKSSFHQMP